MRSAGPGVRRPRSTAIAGKPFSRPFLARACGRDATESPEDADALASRFVGRHYAAGLDRAWLRDRRQAPKRASTRRLGEDAQAWWRHDDSSSPDRRAWSESTTAPHIAAMADASELTMNAIAAWAGLVAKCQRLARTPEAVAQLADRNGIVGNLTEVYRTSAPALRAPPLLSRSVLCEYPSQQIGYVPLGPSPMHEALCRPAGLTLVPLHIG